MNHLPPPPHMPPNFRNQPNRRQNEYHYPPPTHHHHHHAPPPQPPPPLPQQQQQQQQQQQHHLAYPAYVHPQQQYHGPIPMQHYPQQWYQPYQHYGPPTPRLYHQQPPLIVSSHPNAQPVMPVTRQPLPHNPQPLQHPLPDTSTPSTVSQNIASPSTTPTTASAITSTPPVSVPKPSSFAAPPSASPSTSPAPIPPPQRTPFFPDLPWLSVPESDFPSRALRRRRRRKPADLSSNEVELPSRPLGDAAADAEEFTEPDAQRAIVMPDELPVTTPLSTPHVTPADGPPSALATPAAPPVTVSPTAQTHKRTATKPVIPAIPIIPVNRERQRSSMASPPVEAKSPPIDPIPTPETKPDDVAVGEAPVTSPLPIKVAPKSWAELLRAKAPAANGAIGGSLAANGTGMNGVILPKTGSLADVLRLYNVENEGKLSFLEPRGLVNTGNMCYMNSILQTLVFCVPFYEFLDQVSKRAVHTFKSDTPLVEAMILFMREYTVIDSAISVDQLRRRLKDNELEQYGEPFIPEYVYDVIKSLPRFSTMRRGHQQDAEEFLGFLLEGLHDECVSVMRKAASDSASVNSPETVASPTSERSDPTSSADNGWMEVGPKQKPSVTRSSGVIVTESPVTKIFGGKLRSVFRVPGLKDSVTLEPYQPLQLDIGAPNIYNITDALKGLTRSETLHGEFNSPRGPGATATKQVFIETLPPVLILHLKRFQYDNTGGTQKIWKKIGYPLDLEIPKEVFPQQQRATLSMRPGGLPKYRLIGVVYHHGKNASGGHYTVDVRRQEGREWIRIDDTVIRRIRSDDVASEGSEEDPKTLARALEQHKRDQEADKTMYKATGFGGLNDEEDGNDDEDESRGGWSQVNGNSSSPVATATTAKKWSSVANGTATPKSSVSGKQTPRGGAGSKSSVKDNKVAYILFYQQIKM